MKSKQKKRIEIEQVLFDQLYWSAIKNGKLLYPGRLLQRAAQKFSNTTALIYRDSAISYQELYKRALLFTRVIRDYGVKPRNRVIICFENSPEFYISYFAIWQTGAIVIPLNTFLQKKELTHIINDAEAVLVITMRDRVSSFQQLGNKVLPILTEKDIPSAQTAITFSIKITDLDMDEMVALLYTSGTTGMPKGVMLSSRNIMINMLQGLSRLGFVQNERVFGLLPLFHIFAQNTCVWASIFMGVTIILPPKIDRRYILEGLSHKPTIFLGVPAFYGLLCLLKTAPLKSVKLFLSGGDVLPDTIRSLFGLIYRRKICNGYGLTETSPIISVDLDGTTEPTSNVGYPVIGVSCSIRDQKGNILPKGKIGILWVTGENVMLGYYRSPNLTNEMLKDGWFNTGDLAYIDAKGKIIITGREKDLIIHKGLNIYPQEIENVILSYPNVLQVGVIGKKDETVGEIPVAFVRLRKKEVDIEQRLRKLCAQHLAVYKVPRFFICGTKEIATTATGKVDKKVLRIQIVDKE